MNGIIIYKTVVSLLFGLLGFFSNFHTITFQFGEYTTVFLFGLIFPLMITLSWGWKYGLVSALFGGCQTMWWLWGPSNGYAVFLIVPPFTLWIVWHGIWADKRKNNNKSTSLLNLFLGELPFRLLNSLNLLTITRLAVSRNPPSWNWAVNSADSIPMEFSVFVVIKQAGVATVLLLLTNLLLNFNPVRVFFKLKPLVDQKRTGYLVSLSLLTGCLYWFIDSFFFAFTHPDGGSFIDYFARDIPDTNLFTRIVFFVFCLSFGIVMAKILRRQKEDEIALKKAREEAVTREAFLSALFNTIPDYVWLKDRNSKYISCNAKFAEFMGKTEEQVIGTTDSDHFPAEMVREFEYFDKKVMEEKTTIVYVTDNSRISDSHDENIETIKAPMHDKSGNLIGVLGIGRDITERTILQKQLIQAQKMESIGRLAGGIAHDFNNMISVILGASDLIIDDLPKTHQWYEYIREIQNAAERSEQLTGQLLAFARKQTISPRILNMNETVDAALKMIRRLIGENIELIWKPSEDLWSIKADPVQIDQILANLCVNAGDAIETIGTITISTENISFDADSAMEHPGLKSGDYVAISISDTGHGMDRETREHIFEPFYTTKNVGKGTGLGLSTVYGIMKQHQGSIYVYSEPGQGCVFKLYFPRFTGMAGETKRNGDSENDILLTGHETVILVEDEPAMLSVTVKQLEKLGYRVRAFSNPGEAIEEIENIDKVDLLITDVIMPDMNGKEVYRKIKKLHPNIKCLFVSGYTADVISKQGILEEGLFFLSKPFSRKSLGEKIRKIMDSK